MHAAGATEVRKSLWGQNGINSNVNYERDPKGKVCDLFIRGR